jgi:hypothetical protein
VALGADDSSPIGEVPEAGVVSSVSFTPEANITGANTNTRLLQLVNTGQNGAGTTIVATLQFDSGINATAYDEKQLTLSGTAANLIVAAGDILRWNSTHVGTGIADPGGLVQVECSRA